MIPRANHEAIIDLECDFERSPSGTYLKQPVPTITRGAGNFTSNGK